MAKILPHNLSRTRQLGRSLARDRLVAVTRERVPLAP